MRIAFVNDTFLYGRGADTVIYELAKRLGKRHEVFVLAGQTDIKEENFHFIKIGVEKLYTGGIKDFNFPYKLICLKKELKKIQEEHKFDVLNLFHSALNPALVGLPHIVTWLGSPKTKNILRKGVNKTLLRFMKNQKVVVISEYLRKRLKFIKNVKIIPCGISKDFKPGKKNLQGGYMLYVGRLEKHKSVDELVRLSKELEFPLKIAGYGPLDSELKDYSKRIAADKVDFLGRVSHEKLVKLYQGCDFFVSASKWEGFGLIFAEAGACGKPSIAYGRGAIPEVIRHRETGFLVENFRELKQRAEELIKDKKARRKLGEEALKFSERFDWERVAIEYEGVLGKDSNIKRIDYKNKKVLVNGVSGFIGSNLSKALLKKGAMVYSIDNFSYINVKLMKKNFPQLKKIKIINGDVSKEATWKKVPKDIEYIFHFSAPSSIEIFKEQPQICYNETFWGLFQAFEFAKRHGVKKVIFPSSGNVYSRTAMPHSEIKYPMPRNMYAATKMACEALGHAYRDYVKSVGLRIFAGYGPGEEWKDVPSAAHQFLRDMMNGKSPEIWGDGNQTRDLIYVEDIVKMIIMATETDYDGIVNAGTGKAPSFKELVEEINLALGKNMKPVFVPREISYIEHAKADINLTKKLFPIKTTPLRDGIKKYVGYLKEIGL